MNILVDVGQVMDEVTTETPLLQHPAAVLVDAVLPFALRAEQTGVLDKVLTNMHLSAALHKGAGTKKPRAFIVVSTNLRIHSTRWG